MGAKNENTAEFFQTPLCVVFDIKFYRVEKEIINTHPLYKIKDLKEFNFSYTVEINRLLNLFSSI